MELNMKKTNLNKVALLGLTSGLIISNQLNAETSAKPTSIAEKKADSKVAETDANDSNMGYHVLTEDELLMELTSDGEKMYNSLSPEGKRLALVEASMRCAKTNECKGLGACKTAEHDCAGLNSCQGQGICAVGDKNLAVKLVYNKMNNKRNALNQQNQR